jgi:hypothetical protein
MGERKREHTSWGALSFGLSSLLLLEREVRDFTVETKSEKRVRVV